MVVDMSPALRQVEAKTLKLSSLFGAYHSEISGVPAFYPPESRSFTSPSAVSASMKAAYMCAMTFDPTGPAPTHKYVVGLLSTQGSGYGEFSYI